MQWTRLEMYNSVHDLLCHMTMTGKLYYKALLTTMNYCVGGKNQGLFLKLTRSWDERQFEFVIHGWSDPD